jgi:hypothetical protein
MSSDTPIPTAIETGITPAAREVARTFAARATRGT